MRAPRDRCFEIACATDPRLFHPRYRGQRSHRNFFASSGGGMLRASSGEATWLLPPQRLRDFAGSQRLYYALGVYGNPRGDDATFTIEPDQLDRVPFVQIAPDFTGRALARFGGSREPGSPSRDQDSRYGARSEPMRWGGDAALARYRGSAATIDDTDEGEAYGEAAAGTVEAEEPPGYEDAPDLAAHGIAGTEVEPAEPPGVEHVGELPTDLLPSQPMPAAAAARSTTRPAPRAPAATAGGRYGRPVQTAARPAAQQGRGSGATFARAKQADAEFQPPGRAEDYQEEDMLEAVALRALGEGTAAAGDFAAAAIPFNDAERRLVLYAVARFESGLRPADIGDPQRLARAYGICNRNTDGAGLSYGVVQFTQKSGNLGRLLQRLQTRDAAAFERVFGANAGQLLAVTNAADEAARMQPVGGEELWSDGWVARFADAGRVEAFQAEQDLLGIQMFLEPNLQLARWLDFTTDRALAMLLDRCVQQGNGGGRSWILSRVGPLRDETSRKAALQALGFARLRDFQAAVPGLGDDGKWGPMTHAAMLDALRGLGDQSPIAVPSRDEMLDAIVASSTAENRTWAHRPRALRTDRDLLHDTLYTV